MPTAYTSPDQQIIDRKRAIAMALQQASMQPLQPPAVRGARISPLEGVNKIAQALMAGYQNNQLDQQQQGLTAQNDRQRMAQALALSNSVVPQPEGLPAAMAQPQEAQIPGENAVPAMPTAPQMTQLPVGPGQVEGHNATVSALAKALSSNDPVMQDAGKTLLASLLTGTREEKTQAAESARQLAGFQNQAGLQRSSQQAQLAQTNLVQTGENQRNEADIASRMAIAQMKPEPNKPLPTADVQDYQFYSEQELKAGRTPLSFFDWQKQKANFKPSTASEQTVVVKTIDENGNPVTQIVPKVAGTTIKGAPTAQEQNRRNQADIVNTEAARILKMIDATPNAVGPIMGRIAKGETIVGNVPPEAKALGTALASFEALMPILHGFRGGSQTMDHFTNVIGDQKLNAAALKASIKEIQALADNIRSGKVPEATSATDMDSLVNQVFGAPKK